jgi:arginase
MAAVQTLGVVSCLGGPMRFCGFAAQMLRDLFSLQKQNRVQLQWRMLYPEPQGLKEDKLASINKAISRFTEDRTHENQRFLVIGGDHSCAMGTWGGVLNGLQLPDRFGLIWLDAHMDAHTYLTSPSGNVHGMPVAALLGKSDEKLAAIYPSYHFITPAYLILIGVRDYEQEEYGLLKHAGVEIVFANQMNGVVPALIKAVNKLSMTCHTVGISIDLDVIDPADAPGVETPVKDGIKAKELLTALSLIKGHPKICGLEMSEFSPEKDINHKTLYLMKAIVEAFYGEPDFEYLLESSKPNKFLGSSSSGTKSNPVPS